MSHEQRAVVVDVDLPWEWPKMPGASEYVNLRDSAHRTFGFSDPYSAKVIILISLHPRAEIKQMRLCKAIREYRNRGFKGKFFIVAYGSPGVARNTFHTDDVPRTFQDPDKHNVIKAVTSNIIVAET